MKNFWEKWLLKQWYRETVSVAAALLLPFSFCYAQVLRLRRAWYLSHPKAVTQFSVPVLVVGNLTVGGTGKTPLVIWLVNFFRERGYRPGVVSRGYGGQAASYPQQVTLASDPKEVGDEPLLIVEKTGCPVVVSPKRVEAAQALLAEHHCDLLISDDGLQHYALGRDLEIVVIDGEREFGNGYCLPAGPLRESLARMETVDFAVVNGAKAMLKEFSMQLRPGKIYNLTQPELTAERDDFAGHAVYALAGIGHPQRFFQTVQELGISIWPCPFPDHHSYQAQDFNFPPDAKILMTEKDAVKCREFADYRFWCLPIQAELPSEFGEALLTKLAWVKSKILEQEPAGK